MISWDDGQKKFGTIRIQCSIDKTMVLRSSWFRYFNEYILGQCLILEPIRAVLNELIFLGVLLQNLELFIFSFVFELRTNNSPATILDSHHVCIDPKE
jgi:hypothetical protein